jgi:hypothetical protein
LKADEPQWEPRGGEVDLVRFAEAVDVARAEAEIGDVIAVSVAARDRTTSSGRTVLGDWRAAAYQLDRRDRSRAATSFAAATGGTGAGYSLNASAVDEEDDDGVEDLIRALDRMDARRTTSPAQPVKAGTSKPGTSKVKAKAKR